MTTATGVRAEDILETLTRVIEPGYGINIVDLGLVYGIEVNRGSVSIQMTMTAPDSPGREAVLAGIHETVRRRHAGIDEIVIDVVYEPEWRPDFITEAGELQLRAPITHSAAGDGELTESTILESLKLVLDPEVGVNIVDLGLIYNVLVKGRAVQIEMTLTTPGCPLHDSIEAAVRRVLETRHPGIVDIQLDLVWEPAWDVDKITPAGKKELGW